MYAKDLPVNTVVYLQTKESYKTGEYIKIENGNWLEVYGEDRSAALLDSELDEYTYKVLSLPVMNTPFVTTATPYPSQPIKELLLKREVNVAIWSEYSLVNCPHSEVLCDECREAWSDGH